MSVLSGYRYVDGSMVGEVIEAVISGIAAFSKGVISGMLYQIITLLNSTFTFLYC